jgi:hypothetical protein
MSGALLICCWRFVYERLHTVGAQPLLEIWSLLATTLFLGQSVCRLVR